MKSGVFQFKLPPPEEDENGDIIPLTKAEIKELKETQSEEEKARLSDLSASTLKRALKTFVKKTTLQLLLQSWQMS